MARSWRLARSLQTLRDEVRDVFPHTTIWTVGDADHASRPSDHNPNDHDDDASTPGVVSAIDVVGGEQAKAVWAHLLETRDPRVEYMIFAARVVGADTGWEVRPYTGSNPHYSHAHVSVGRGSDSDLTRPDLFDDPSPWGFSKDTDMANTTPSEWHEQDWDWGLANDLVNGPDAEHPTDPKSAVTMERLVALLRRYHDDVDKVGVGGGGVSESDLAAALDAHADDGTAHSHKHSTGGPK